jgi:dGTP triphosphohydrolase
MVEQHARGTPNPSHDRLCALPAMCDAARLVCDYIGGMTDRYAAAEHRRLFDEIPELQLRA